MLYDPKWENKVEHNVYSLAGLIKWLETQPADTAYDFDSCHGECLIGQYLKAKGEHYGPGAWSNFCHLVPEIRGRDIALDDPHTFGAALERARAVS